MSAVMEKKPRTKKKAPPSADPKSLSGERLRVHPKQLVRHPDNRHPSEAAIASVAASLAKEGQIEPVLVRLLHGPDEFQNFATYQIISGETRQLASLRLGWDSIEIERVDLDDAATLRVLAAANAARQDLDPIAKARLIVRLCQPVAEGGSGLTREAAAKMFDLQSGGAASNLVRLLELPQPWQDQVASGELPQSYARELLALTQLGADSPAWGDTFVAWNQRGDDGKFGPFYSRDDVQDYACELLHRHSRPIEKDDNHLFEVEPRCMQRHPLRFKLTPSLEEELRIVELDLGDGEVRRRATNCKLYDLFQIPAIKQWNAKKSKGQSPSDDDEDAQPAKLSPKEQAAVERERREKAAETLAKRVEVWRAAWLRDLVADRIDRETAVRLCLWLIARSSDIGYRDRAALGLSDLLPWRGVVSPVRDVPPWDVARHVLSYQPAHDGEHPIPDDNVEDLVELLQIDLEDAWLLMQSSGTRPERMQEFFELHSSEQLDALGRELEVGTIHASKKADKVALLMGAPKTLKLPRCLRSLRGKRGGK